LRMSSAPKGASKAKALNGRQINDVRFAGQRGKLPSLEIALTMQRAEKCQKLFGLQCKSSPCRQLIHGGQE
jgi:hypothetical protein